MPGDGVLQAEIAHGKHVGAREIENQEHFRRPAADALDLHQQIDKFVVRQALPFGGPQPAIVKMRCQVVDVSAFLARQTTAAQFIGGRRHDHGWRHFAVRGGESIAHTLRGFHRNLLPHNGARQRLKRVATAANG